MEVKMALVNVYNGVFCQSGVGANHETTLGSADCLKCRLMLIGGLSNDFDRASLIGRVDEKFSNPGEFWWLINVIFGEILEHFAHKSQICLTGS